MTAHVLISGSLWKNPEQRSSSRTGKLFTVATIRAGSDDGGGDFWSITAFSESVQAELLRLGAGDALSAQGKLKIETYVANDGKTKISRSIVVDAILALRAPPKERRAKAAPVGSKAADQIVKESILPPSGESSTESAPFYDDQIPF